MTRGVADALEESDVLRALARHQRGDWGFDVERVSGDEPTSSGAEEDVAANNFALREGGRLVSVYRSREGARFFVITEADRSATTILLPEEY